MPEKKCFKTITRDFFEGPVKSPPGPSTLKLLQNSSIQSIQSIQIFKVTKTDHKEYFEKPVEIPPSPKSRLHSCQTS